MHLIDAVNTFIKSNDNEIHMTPLNMKDYCTK